MRNQFYSDLNFSACSMIKKFRIPDYEIRPLATGKGSCIASDEITIQGKRVGFMYRDIPYDETDSGWRFFSGDETQEFTDDPTHFEIYDVNTIANYEPAIIDLLDSPVMSAFGRNPNSENFEPTPFPVSGLQ